MAYEKIQNQNNQELNLDSTDLPVGTKLRCKTTAVGNDSLGNPISIELFTDPIELTESSTDPGDAEGTRILNLGNIDLETQTWAPKVQPQSYSDPDGGEHPADSETMPIARWNVVPMQVIDSAGFDIGVVAFHANGIDRVEFEANNGSVTTIRQMTVNPRTGNREFWVTLDVPENNDSLIEIRATVYPNLQGKPFILQNVTSYTQSLNGNASNNPEYKIVYAGSYTNDYEGLMTKVSDVTDSSGVLVSSNVVLEGEHSMFVWGPSKYSNSGKLYVSAADGNDEVGDGTESNPFETINAAWEEIRNNDNYQYEGAEIILMTPGIYTPQEPRNSNGYAGGGLAGWTTIRGMDTHNASEYLIGANDEEELVQGNRPYSRVGSQLTKFENVCFRAGLDTDLGDTQWVAPQRRRSMVWFDRTYHFDKKGRSTGESRGSGLITTNGKIAAWYVTDANFYDRRKSAGGCIIIRNTSFIKAADTDIYSNSSMVLDCTAANLKASGKASYPKNAGNNTTDVFEVDFSEEFKDWPDQGFDVNPVKNGATETLLIETFVENGQTIKEFNSEQEVKYSTLIGTPFKNLGVGLFRENMQPNDVDGFGGWQEGDDEPSEEQYYRQIVSDVEDDENRAYSLQNYYDPNGFLYYVPGDELKDNPHIDVWQITGGSYLYPFKKNQICFGLHVYDTNDVQPFLFDQTRSIHVRHATVDFSCAKNTINNVGPVGINIETGGDFEGEGVVSDHIYISNCSFQQYFKIGRDQEAGANGVFRNSLFQNSTYTFLESFGTLYTLRSGFWLRNNIVTGGQFSGSGTNNDPDYGNAKWENVINVGPNGTNQGFDLSTGPDRYIDYDSANGQWTPENSTIRGILMPGFVDDPPIGSLRAIVI